MLLSERQAQVLMIVLGDSLRAVDPEQILFTVTHAQRLALYNEIINQQSSVPQVMKA